MKPILILTLLASLMQLNNAFGQTLIDTVQLKVYYNFTHISDLKTKQIVKDRMILSIGNKTSKYLSLNNLEYTNAIKQFLNSQSNEEPEVIFKERGTKAKIFSLIYDSVIYIQDYIVNDPYLIKDIIEPINWKIIQEYKKIDKYNCQKAEGYFRGRKYTIWFSRDLNYPIGPWKLKNAPGLILEAKDENREIMFEFSKIEFNPKSSINSLKMPDQIITLSLFNKLEQKEIETKTKNDRINPYTTNMPTSKQLWLNRRPTNKIEK